MTSNTRVWFTLRLKKHTQQLWIGPWAQYDGTVRRAHAVDMDGTQVQNSVAQPMGRKPNNMANS